MIGSSTHYFDEKKDHHTLLHNTLNIGGCLYYTLVFAYRYMKKIIPQDWNNISSRYYYTPLYFNIYRLHCKKNTLFSGLELEFQKFRNWGYRVTRVTGIYHTFKITAVVPMIVIRDDTLLVFWPILVERGEDRWRGLANFQLFNYIQPLPSF